MTPIFLFSLPRSGSTLLQRVLGAHNQVATVAEPWLLLPLFYGLRDRGSLVEYDQHLAAAAIGEFLAKMQCGEQAYRAGVRDLALALYQEVADDEEAVYFLDKTPRYYFIIREILETFDDAKFIFLWRNPLAAAASMLETWSANKFKIHKYQDDLEDGLIALIDAWSSCSDRVCAVNYEKFVSDPELELRRICDYMGIEFAPGMISGFPHNELVGSMGDPKRRESLGIETASLHTWVDTMNTPVRRWWCQRYIERIGEHRLNQIGYAKKELMEQLDAAGSSPGRTVSDIFYLSWGAVITWIKRGAKWVLSM